MARRNLVLSFFTIIFAQSAFAQNFGLLEGAPIGAWGRNAHNFQRCEILDDITSDMSVFGGRVESFDSEGIVTESQSYVVENGELTWLEGAGELGPDWYPILMDVTTGGEHYARMYRLNSGTSSERYLCKYSSGASCQLFDRLEYNTDVEGHAEFLGASDNNIAVWYYRNRPWGIGSAPLHGSKYVFPNGTSYLAPAVPHNPGFNSDDIPCNASSFSISADGIVATGAACGSSSLEGFVNLLFRGYVYHLFQGYEFTGPYSGSYAPVFAPTSLNYNVRVGRAVSPNGEWVAGTANFPIGGFERPLQEWYRGPNGVYVEYEVNSFFDDSFGEAFITNDGKLIGGRFYEESNPDPNSGSRWHAHIRDNIRGLRQSLKDYLAYYGLSTGSYHPVNLKYISPDRTQYVGAATAPNGDCVAYQASLSPSSQSAVTEGRYAPWNTYLRMQNILELVNNTSTAQSALVRIFRQDGSIAFETTYYVGPNSQQDIVLNDIPGTAVDAYGLVNVIGDIEGRVLFYKQTGFSAAEYDFAFGLDLAQATAADTETFVTYNTFQPSLVPEDADKVVLNWLALINLSPNEGTFRVQKFDEDGSLLSDIYYLVAPFGRIDVEGGHILPGVDRKGLIRILADVPSMSQLVRYGSGKTPADYEFAFPLVSKSADAGESHVMLPAEPGGQTYLELVNVLAEQLAVTLRFYDSAGSLVSVQSLLLPGNGQIHLDASSVMGEAEGHVEIDSSEPDGIIAQAMVYYRNPFGKLLAMYGSQASSRAYETGTGSYNLYLGMTNALRVLNPGTTGYLLEVQTSSFSGPGATNYFQIPGKGALVLNLNDTQTFGTLVNTYGAVTASAPVGAELVLEITRSHYNVSGDRDFVVRTTAK